MYYNIFKQKINKHYYFKFSFSFLGKLPLPQSWDRLINYINTVELNYNRCDSYEYNEDLTPRCVNFENVYGVLILKNKETHKVYIDFKFYKTVTVVQLYGLYPG